MTSITDHSLPADAVPDDDDDLLGEEDPDMRVLAKYLTNNLSAEERNAFEDRLADDRELYLKVWPAMAFWANPSASFRRKYQQTFAPKALAREQRRRTINNIVIVALISLTTVIGMPSIRSWVGHENEIGDHRASTTGLESVTRIENGLRERHELTLPNGVRVLVDSASRFTFGRMEGSDVEGGALDGDATIDVPNTVNQFSLNTFGGPVTLFPGRYHIHAEPGSIDVRITTAIGKAMFRGRTIAR